ncbi:hypothetical protein JCM3770_005971 [Rhodotorula araucariae]
MSIRGNFPLTSTPSSPQRQRRRPSTSGLSYSSPGVPQLHSMPTRNESPQTHPPQAGPYLHAHHGHAHAGAGGTAVGGLSPLTPISNPASPGGSGGSGSGGGPASSTLSLTSISSASTTHTTTTGISRASSVRSTSSVQAVPMRKPQRGPAVPRIVTRGINALGAYGVGVPNSAQSPTRAANAPLTAANIDAKGKAHDAAAERPSLPARASWRRRKGDGLGSRGVSPLPSPVHEGGSASPSSPKPPAPDCEGWLAKTALPDSPSRGPGAVGAEGDSWPRPRYERADPAQRDDLVRERQTSDTTARGSDDGDDDVNSGDGDVNSDVRAGSLSPPSSPTPRPSHPPHARTSKHERGLSGAGTAGPTTPRSPRMGSARVDWGAVGEARRGGGEGSAERAAQIGMSPNAMGVVGNRRSTEDFEFGEVLGEGSYSTVTHVTTIHPPYRQYALKVLDKEHIKRERKTKYVLIERDTLKALDGHPGIIKLWWTFQDEWSLYYVLEYAENGELLHWIKKYGSFDLRSARYYVAQILSAVGFMHEKGVIHRDLKPENILLDRSMRVKITDFGTAKLLKREEIKDGQPGDDPQGRPRARSFVGTPEYVSPEILSEGRESSFSSDFWALGCVLFQMLAGRPPFQARTEYLMFQKIVNLEFEFPLGFPADAKDLVEKLLVVDPKARLGGDPANGNGIEAVMGHPFFSSHIPPRPMSPSASQPHSPTLSARPSESPTASLRRAPSSSEAAVLTPAPSVAAFGKTDAQAMAGATINPVDTLVGMASKLELDSPNDTPPASSTPRPPHHGPSPAPPPEETLDCPIDWSTIWTVEPPRIHTGLTPPTPTIRGEFVLLGGGGDSSVGPSPSGTGLTGQRSWDGSVDAQTREDTYLDEDEDGWEEGADVDRGSLSDDDFAEPGSPTSTSGRDLPPASTFGGGKWSNVLLPSESILMCSPILQRPSGGAAAARTALLRSPRLKFSPRSLLSSSSSSNTSPGASPHNGTIPLPAPSPPINSANGLLMAGAPSPPLHGGLSPPATGAPLPSGWKPRTLILTDYPRLLCIKESPDKITVKSEVFLGSALRGGVRREGVSAFIAVEPRGTEGKGFSIRTSSRTLKFEEPSGQASRWIAELQEAHRAGLMNSHPRR